MLIGALTLGIGVAVGLSIPSTNSEDKLVGEYRDRFLAKAKDKANDLAEIAKETVRTAASSGAGSAKKQLSGAGISTDSPPTVAPARVCPRNAWHGRATPGRSGAPQCEVTSDARVSLHAIRSPSS